MKSSNTLTKAIPDPSGQERLWFSHLLAPARCKRLSSGEPIGRDLFDLVRSGIAAALTELKPNRRYKAKYFVEDWDDLSHGDRRRAGRCIADFARRPGSPIGLIRRGKGQSHRYFIRPVTHQAPSKQHPNHHQP